ncbi:hypothetical protein SCA6_016743 [Theobroma cacao]
MGRVCAPASNLNEKITVDEVDPPFTIGNKFSSLLSVFLGLPTGEAANCGCRKIVWRVGSQHGNGFELCISDIYFWRNFLANVLHAHHLRNKLSSNVRSRIGLVSTA